VATAPLQDVRLGIAEAEYAIEELGLHGVIIYQNVNGKDLDGEFLWPFYERIEALGVPLLVHGVDSGPLLGVDRFARFNLDVCLGFPFEVSRRSRRSSLAAFSTASPTSSSVSSKSASAGFPG